MDRWSHIDVTSSRRPLLPADEPVLYVQDGVGLYNGRHKLVDYQDGVLYITGKRLCYVDSEKPALRSIAVSLAEIDRLGFYVGFLKSSSKITLSFVPEGAQAGATRSSRSGSIGASHSLVPTTADFVCPVCTFTNTLDGNYKPGDTLPACNNCGMPPGKRTRVTFATAQGQAHTHLPRLPTRRPSSATPTSQVQSSPSLSIISSSSLPLDGDISTQPSQRQIDRSMPTFPCPRCTFGNHPAITTCELCGAPLLSRNLPPMLAAATHLDDRARVSNATQVHRDPLRVNAFASAAAAKASASSSHIASALAQDRASCKLAFRRGGEKAFLERLRLAVAARVWETTDAVTSPLLADRTGSSHSSRSMTPLGEPNVSSQRRIGAGISGLQTREESLRVKDATTLSTAFEDLDALRVKATEVIALAESLAKRVAASQSVQNGTDLHGTSISMAEPASLLRLTGPVVTKETAGKGSVFHAELARQISDLLEAGALKATGGALTLADLYALYNRARKGNLISPADLMAACRLFDTLKLPVKLRKFRSGVTVVQDRSRTEESVEKSVVRWLVSRTLGASAMDAAAQFGWSVGVATEELETVEARGGIVRDASIEGLRFYVNRFSQADWDPAVWLQEQVSEVSLATPAQEVDNQ
ncbi:EAP30/Vps36 family-domain-containing protein [Protomyces lactucae-debilis]|uniref:Vacuolar protein-sorting-associated protein 36 n=1 Tax=Protomyces lactucae-debilis TaxID=2754530 RepID=A0A1Y2FQB9_PROLT|nr:EAP30/Vps36 family-domain-containing protein [Protomyces lactucae-debilis]ORY86180.1 EAP30/Vps36 family-domain-containing protein [Protomyces lactucae-debilis]